MFGFLKKYFLTGLLVLSPIVITGYIFWKVFILLDNLINPLQSRYPFLDIPGIGIVAVIVFVVLVGFLASNLMGRRILSLAERSLNHIPLIRGIYSTIKEISQVFFADRSTVFKQVVLVQYPHPGSYALGFLTQEGQEYLHQITGKEIVNIFLPTSPNPTSGYLLLVPRSDVITTGISVEEGLKMVVSGGAVVPQRIRLDSNEK